MKSLSSILICRLPAPRCAWTEITRQYQAVSIEDALLTGLAAKQKRPGDRNRAVFFVQKSHKANTAVVTHAVNGVDQACSTDNFDHNVNADTSSELEHFVGPIWSLAVVDCMGSSELAGNLELLIRRRSGNYSGAGCRCDLQKVSTRRNRDDNLPNSLE